MRYGILRLMKTEFETRFLEINKEELISKLLKLGAVDKGEFKLKEEIFYDNDLIWLKQNKFIRIRKKGEKITLTYKHNQEQKVDSAKEIEFEISSMDAASNFLNALDLIKYRVIEKYRHTFELEGVTFDIDTWPKIPVYVELEGNSVEEIKMVAEKLGFNWDKRFDKDARYVFNHYGYDFDNIRTVTFDKFE